MKASLVPAGLRCGWAAAEAVKELASRSAAYFCFKYPVYAALGKFIAAR